jgi:hypothetical protein
MFSSLIQGWFELGIALSSMIGGIITGIVYARPRAASEEKKQIEEASISFKGSTYQAKHTVIHETLTDLRIKVKADRARIAHFHNGGKFLDGTPMKKFSITHESCERGVPYDGGNLQNILVTMFWNLIETMRDNDPRVYHTEIMPDGYFRSYNKSNGIVGYAILPIMKQELYIGFVELEWFDEEKIPTGEHERLMAHHFEQSRDYIELELALR